MNQRQAKKLRREARKEARRLLGDAQTQLMQTVARSSLKDRLAFAWKVVFR